MEVYSLMFFAKLVTQITKLMYGKLKLLGNAFSLKKDFKKQIIQRNMFFPVVR